ncbi:hypothetical protein Lal_00043737 [Lupinus albus]|nr:hypothetical protein Lal_00043737 [Lupinus albus]
MKRKIKKKEEKKIEKKKEKEKGLLASPGEVKGALISNPSHESPRPSMLTRPRRHIFNQVINDVSHAWPSIKQAIHTFSSA